MNDKDSRVVLPSSSNTYRLELFTKRPDNILNPMFPAFKLGYFRVKIADNALGERYFITDLKEEDQTADTVLIHDDESKAKIRLCGITPVYQCRRIEMYKMGFYQSHNLYNLHISTDGVELINKFD